MKVVLENGACRQVSLKNEGAPLEGSWGQSGDTKKGLPEVRKGP